MLVPSLPAVPRIDATLVMGGDVVDLAARVLVVGVVPAPRFGREGEVVATAAALSAAGADVVDVSMPPRMVGPVVRAGQAPVVVRASTVDAAAEAGRAGAVGVLVPATHLAEVAGLLDRAGGVTPSAVVVALVDDLAAVADARVASSRLGVPLAFDSTRWSGADAIARESAAVADGCRLLRTADVRRSRRVAEVMSAVLGARRPVGVTPTDDPGSRP